MTIADREVIISLWFGSAIVGSVWVALLVNRLDRLDGAMRYSAELYYQSMEKITYLAAAALPRRAPPASAESELDKGPTSFGV